MLLSSVDAAGVLNSNNVFPEPCVVFCGPGAALSKGNFAKLVTTFRAARKNRVMHMASGFSEHCG